MIRLSRIDDRLIHGQVVVGWGQPLNARFIVLVDDEVAVSDWEQELYNLGVPSDMPVYFHSVESAAGKLAEYEADARTGILLTGCINTMQRLVESGDGTIRSVNVGGIHHSPGRSPKLRYVFLSPDEEEALKSLAGHGVEVTAQDVPSSPKVSLADLLAGDASK